jgi:uroporphyrinogen decarboxylase
MSDTNTLHVSSAQEPPQWSQKLSSRVPAQMSAQQRVAAAIAGQQTDRVPVTAWIHFGSEHLPPEQTAALHLAFAQTYSPDLLKIHADYRLSVSDSHDLRDADDILQIGRAAKKSPCFVQQKQCVSAVIESAQHRCVMMDTLFSPFQNLLRNVGADQLPLLMKYPQQTLDTLAYITEASCEHVHWLQTQGLSICLFATHGAIAAERYKGLARERRDEIVEHWIQPFDKQLLIAASGMTRILHAHGQGLQIERVRDYEFEVLHVSTELEGNPTLSALRQWTDKCVMGGINEASFTGLSLAGLQACIDQALVAAGPQKFILAPGCSLPSHTPARLLRHLLSHTSTRKPSP